MFLIFITISFQAQADEQQFQDELQLPQAHYSPSQRKLVVEVVPDDYNQENFKQQEAIINTIYDDSPVPVEVVELPSTQN